MFDYLLSQNSSEQATSVSILAAVVCSFFLSSLVVLTYEITHRGKPKSPQFLMSMALISIVATTVMQAVGDSLARGLGMLGALAIIRFRTNLDNPLSITYMFASLAVGISCGVFGFTIAFAGTLTFCAAALLLHVSPFWGTENLRGTLRVILPLESTANLEIEGLLGPYCKSFKVDQIRIEQTNAPSNSSSSDDEEADQNTASIQAIQQSKEVVYHIWMHDPNQSAELMQKVYGVNGVISARVRFSVPDPNL